MKRVFTTATCLLIFLHSFSQWSVISDRGDGHLFFINDSLGWSLKQKTTDGGHTSIYIIS